MYVPRFSKPFLNGPFRQTRSRNPQTCSPRSRRTESPKSRLNRTDCRIGQADRRIARNVGLNCNQTPALFHTVVRDLRRTAAARTRCHTADGPFPRHSRIAIRSRMDLIHTHTAAVRTDQNHIAESRTAAPTHLARDHNSRIVRSRSHIAECRIAAPIPLARDHSRIVRSRGHTAECRSRVAPGQSSRTGCPADQWTRHMDWCILRLLPVLLCRIVGQKPTWHKAQRKVPRKISFSCSRLLECQELLFPRADLVDTLPVPYLVPPAPCAYLEYESDRGLFNRADFLILIKNQTHTGYALPAAEEPLAGRFRNSSPDERWTKQQFCILSCLKIRFCGLPGESIPSRFFFNVLKFQPYSIVLLVARRLPYLHEKRRRWSNERR